MSQTGVTEVVSRRQARMNGLSRRGSRSSAAEREACGAISIAATAPTGDVAVPPA